MLIGHIMLVVFLRFRMVFLWFCMGLLSEVLQKTFRSPAETVDMILWYHDITISCYYAIMPIYIMIFRLSISWYYDITILRYHDIMLLCLSILRYYAYLYHDIMISWYYDIMPLYIMLLCLSFPIRNMPIIMLIGRITLIGHVMHNNHVMHNIPISISYSMPNKHIIFYAQHAPSHYQHNIPTSKIMLCLLGIFCK